MVLRDWYLGSATPSYKTSEGPEQLAKLANKTGGIDSRTVFQNFEMNMRGGCPAGAAHQGYHLACFHVITSLYDQVVTVRITGFVTVAVIDLNRFAVASAVCRPYHHATRNT